MENIILTIITITCITTIISLIINTNKLEEIEEKLDYITLDIDRKNSMATIKEIEDELNGIRKAIEESDRRKIEENKKKEIEEATDTKPH